ncbi:MAG TPA: family 20 glycosylhydrolase [Gammaproteobacteria bacterium]|nr:family 20 glycosylhydrolase [Gammaproteobacteria bacterium]
MRLAPALLCGLMLATAAQADDAPPFGTTPLTLIPMPAQLQRQPSVFILNDGDSLDVQAGDPRAFEAAAYFAALVAQTRGLKLHVPASVHGASRLTKVGADKQLQPPPAGPAPAISFKLSKADAATFGAEGYSLEVDGDGARIEAATPAGLFYGGVTLWQLMMPYGARGRTAVLPNVSIHDRPRYAWRGLLLDSARHVQSVADIERLIDWMALHKLNVLQWHLTDDQGWRLEIKRYPKLTAIGACRKAVGPDAALTGGAGKPYCGFYTQAEARQIVAYAAARYVTVVPEIEMPGHAQAAIAAYPEFGVTGAHPPVSADWGVHPYLYNVDEHTLGFLQDVLDEVMDIFPSTYIDVGGDEALKDQWKASAPVQARIRELKLADADALQGWLVTRMGGYLQAHGRKLIGWDGILVPGLPQQAAVMVWQSPDLTTQALQQGHDVVIAYSPTLYMDHYQSAAHDEPPGRPPVVSLKDVYGFEPPLPAGATQGAEVLGEQLNLWTEYMPSFARDEHALFPRLAAFAEDAWSPAQARDWSGFLARQPGQLARYKSLGIQYATSAYEETAPLAPASPTTRNSDELATCSDKLVLRIEGPGPLTGPRPVYRVDIMDTCWQWQRAPLDGMGHIAVTTGKLPWNYQLAHDVAGVVVRPADGGSPSLDVRLDGCTGRTLAHVPLHAAATGLQTTLEAALPSVNGAHDLCFMVSGDPKQGLWAIDEIRLTP